METEGRNRELKAHISKMNEHLPNNVYLPLENRSGHRVLRVIKDYSLVLHSNEKAPYHILIEVESQHKKKLKNKKVKKVEKKNFLNNFRRSKSKESSYEKIDIEMENLSLLKV